MAEPIDLADAKRQLRIRRDHEDALIAENIIEARGWVERYTGLILVRREITEFLPSFCHRISAWPIVSISRVAYRDAAGNEIDLDVGQYAAQIERRPAALHAKSWPSLHPSFPVAVTMIAGFESPEAISAFSPNIMRAMRVLVAGYFNDREGGDVAMQAEAYAKKRLSSFRRWTV